MRLICVLLALAMLMATLAFSVFAEKAAERTRAEETAAAVVTAAADTGIAKRRTQNAIEIYIHTRETATHGDVVQLTKNRRYGGRAGHNAGTGIYKA